MKKILCKILAAAFFALCACAIAAEELAPGYGEDTLSGDWNGLRSDWNRLGLAVDIGYKTDLLRVDRGGLKRGGRPIGHFDLRVSGDLEKLLGWSDATAFVNFVSNGGGKSNRDHLGSFMGTSNIEVPVSTTRFYQAWVEKSYFDGKATLLAGLYPIDTEFQALESASLFVQPPYGAAPDMALTRGPSIFNTSALGLRAKWRSKELGLYGMGAVLDGIPGDPDKPKGTHIRLQAGDGSKQIVEFGYRAPPPPVVPGSEAPERFGKYALGFWRYTARVSDLIDIDANGEPERRRSSGWYVLAERTLRRWRAGNLAGFLRFGATDGHSTALKQFYNVGLRARGLFLNREDDILGVAHSRASIGDKFRASQALAGIAATAAESATEITYRIQANKWLAVQPLIQWHRNPGADSAIPSATVIGVRVEVAL